MRVLTVALLATGIPYEELTYFAKDDVEEGDLVEINVKRRNLKGLVITAEKVEDEKQSIRQASFGLKKISKVLIKQFLHPKIWQALNYSSSYLLQPLGTLIYDLLSEKSFPYLTRIEIPEKTKGHELLLLEQSYENRITRYKTTIRESFSKKNSLVMFFPTITDLEYAKDELSKGIDEYAISLHGALTEKQYKDAVNKIKDTEHPILILSTPSLIPWLRGDLGLVIIEREHSQYYYTHGDSGYDMRIVLEHISKKSGVPCLLGSHMLSLYAHRLYKLKDANEVMPLQFRNDSPIIVIPMTDENKSGSPYLSKAALHILHNAKLAERGHYFLYAHRKGMYPTTVCSDCGTLFTCKDCNRPYVLHKIGGVRTYVCHGCENIIRIDEETTLTCRYCGGWRMALLGIATTGVEEELSRLGVPIFVIDSEHTPTRTKVKKVYKEWKEAKYGVLIGTEMAHNIVRDCDGVIILSLDSLFSLPEYRTDEKILNLVTEMAEKVKTNPSNLNRVTDFAEDKYDHKLLLQTRLKNIPVIKQLTSPSFREVYDTLLKERDEFLLPPYYVVVKASFTNLLDDVRTRMEQELEPYVVEWFEQGKGVTLLFVHIKESEWANNTAIRQRIKQVTYDGNPLVNPLHFFI
ncbi:MAG: primosomal protein [Candidatus Nomurabacteria bacterium]|nr:primosomal protein [Candidatus Nomurabacteria bacterium]